MRWALVKKLFALIFIFIIFMKNYDMISYAEQCSQAGFEKLEKMVQDANNNNDELEAELMAELDRLYRKNVELEDF